jgi:membrane protease YdiL (CAAX protease family)
MSNWKGKYQHLAIQNQFLLLFLVLIISFIPCYIIGITPVVVSGATDSINGQNIDLYKWLQSWSSIGIFILSSIIFIYLTEKKFVISKSFTRAQLLLAICSMLFCLPIINFLALWNEGLHLPEFMAQIENWMRLSEAKSATIMEYFVAMDSYTDLVINLVVIALIPAIGEEFLFRGVIQRGLIKWKKKPHFGIWISAFLFSALHMQFLGFIPRFLIGGFFGYLFLWSGSIWLPVITHFLNNALAVLVIFTSSSVVASKKIESMGANSGDIPMVIMCCLAVSLLLYLFYNSKKKSPEEKGI